MGCHASHDVQGKNDTQAVTDPGGQCGHAPHPIVEQLLNYKNTTTQKTIRKKCIQCGQLILRKISKIGARAIPR